MSAAVSPDGDPTLRFRLAARNLVVGSAPGLGALAHLAGALSCSKGTCGVAKENASGVGFLANVAGTVALGAAAVFGGGPVFGAVTGALLATSAVACAFVQDQGR
jgi:hypothetical protein